MLNERTSLWVKKSLRVDVEINSTRRLYGGISAVVYEVAVTVDGEIKEVIVKQYTDQSWLLEEPNVVLDEMANLSFVQQENILAPVSIAVDLKGEETGYPSVLMTKVDGDVVLEPEDFMSWTRGLANALALIHAVDATEFPRTFSPYMGKDEIGVPSWGTVPEQWAQAARIVKGMQPNTKQTFIHRDFHPANVLWHDGNVNGVVDWVNACRGPANVDVGHCRVNLALLHGVEVADQFLAAYLKVASSDFSYHPYWDLRMVFDFMDVDEPPTVYEGWRSLGVEGLTDGMMHERMERYMMSLLSR